MVAGRLVELASAVVICGCTVVVVVVMTGFVPLQF